MFVGSVWDQEDIYGAPALFAATKSSPNAHLVLGPWYHGQANASAFSLGPIDWGSDTGRSFRSEVMIPFLDQYLKGGPPAAIARVTAFAGRAQPVAAARRLAARLRPRRARRS